MSLPTVIERFSALPAFTQLLAAMSESRAVTHVAGLAGSADVVLVAPKPSLSLSFFRFAAR